MRRVRAVGLLAPLLFVTGLMPTSAVAVPVVSQRMGDPTFEMPVEGACYDLRYDQLFNRSIRKAPVDCEEPHTIETVKVKRLTKPVDWKNVYSRIAVSCFDAFYDAFGGPRWIGHYAYEMWWFIPTKAQRAAGARWVRCDVGLRKGTQNLRTYEGGPRILGNTLSGPPTGTLGPQGSISRRCLVGRDLKPSSCTVPFLYYARTSFRLDERPRTRAEYFEAGSRCSFVSNRYAFDGPSLYEWRAGNHIMVCFKRAPYT